MSDQLDLPKEGRLLSAEEIRQTRLAAEEIFERHKDRYSRAARAAEATLVLLDGTDRSGDTFTVGTDMLEIEQRHYHRFKKPLSTACYFTLTKD